jgi:hypothetical protein
MKTNEVVEVQLRTFLISTLLEGEWLASTPSRLPCEEGGPGTHWTRGWVGPRAGLDAVSNKVLVSAWNGKPAAQPVA